MTSDKFLFPIMKTLSATPAPVWSKGQACVAAAGGGGDLAMAQAWVWSAEVEDDAKELDDACCNRMFQVFHMFGKNITSVLCGYCKSRSRYFICMLHLQ